MMFILGIIIGSIIAVLLMSVCIEAGRADREAERNNYE